MEQASFLSSLPFLIPLNTKAWPPRTSPKRVLNDEFDPFVFSIELISDKVTDSQGSDERLHKPKPLYFSEQGDPTLSFIQIYIGSPEDDPEKHLIYLQSGGDRIFLVDAQKVKAIVIEEEVYHPSASNDDDKVAPATKQVKLPPSLIIQFAACQFRIFRNRTVHCQDDKQALRAAGEMLIRASSLASFTVPRENIASPARTSASSSSARHRKESSSNTTCTDDFPMDEGPAIEMDHQDDDDCSDKKRSATKAGFNDNVQDSQDDDGGEDVLEQGCIENRQKSRNDFHERLGLIAQGLRYVQDPQTKAPTALLSRTADCWARSYISAAELNAAEDDQSAEITNQDKMDAVMVSFFPDRKADHRNTAPSTQEATQLINDLLKERKELLKKRSDILLLPIRG